MKIRVQRPKMPNLMLTPMLDMLTVILIFLIVNFAPDESKIQKSAQMHLPESSEKLTSVPKIQVEVAKDYVKLNGKTVDGLNPEAGDPQAWQILKQQLAKLAEETKDPANPNKSEPVLLLADKTTSYRFVDRAVAYMAAAGYTEVFLLTEPKKETQQ